MSEEKEPIYRIFINYRHDDHPDFVEHIRSWFVWHYGRANVFMDFDSIPIGEKFPEYISKQIVRCDALLVIIGPKWVKRMRDKAWETDDWVRIEIGKALREQKSVIPVCIKGAKLPGQDDLPPDIRGMLNQQAFYLDSGKNFIDRIEDAVKDIEALLAKRALEKMGVERLYEISPASGLALGYYANFVRPVGSQLVALNDPRSEPPDIKVGERELEMDQSLELNLVIPHQIRLLKHESLEAVRQSLDQASIQSSAFRRPFSLYARHSNGGYQLIDFPTTLTVVEHWLQRLLQARGLNPQSDEAQKLERDELRNFKTVLEYWIDDQANAPGFRDCVQVLSFDPEDPQLAWLSELWG